MAGSVDAGKSTLVAVLTQGREGTAVLDSGHGSARVAVLRHKHEIESGRTSSLSQQLLGYDAQGRVLNYQGSSGAPLAFSFSFLLALFHRVGGEQGLAGVREGVLLLALALAAPGR